MWVLGGGLLGPGRPIGSPGVLRRGPWPDFGVPGAPLGVPEAALARFTFH